MYDLEIKPELDKVFAKLAKKNPKQLEIIFKKAEEIVENPPRYKNFRARRRSSTGNMSTSTPASFSHSPSTKKPRQ